VEHGLDAPGEAVEAVLAPALLRIVWLSQALARLGGRDPPRLTLVTRGAQAVAPGEAVAVAQGPAWGLGRVLQAEHPELRPKLIDLGLEGGADEVDALLAEVGAADEEDLVALRRDGRYVQRLERATFAPQRPPPPLHPDATYLVTGGLGGLGTELARTLVERGARHLALAARRPPSPAARAAIASIEARGARVLVLQVDVGVSAEVERALAILGRRMPPLAGVVHAAGELSDGSLADLDRDRLAVPLRAKVAGAWNLHVLTAAQRLDFFVLFGSATAILGSPGQANYAAANAFLDALAHHRRALGLQAVSVDWGTFDAIGMAASRAVRGERLARHGLAGLPPSTLDEVFPALLGTEKAQLAVMRFDVARWLESQPAASRRPFWALLRDEAPEPSPQASLRTALAAARGVDRTRLAQRRIVSLLGEVMLVDPARIDQTRSFTALGLDSLMTLEFRSKLEAELGTRVSPGLLFAHPNPASLADHVATLAAGAEKTVGAPLPDLPDLSEFEARVHLRRVLRELGMEA
jgi:NAD(P)-dependent dehydrogenase (short-subunit alcohol dehydrogenase family)/acyl carrier protein